MKRIKLIVAYDGTNYCGWQIQNNGRTIEEVLNEKLTALMKEKIAVIGASRTDAGVHAKGNVAVFDTKSQMAADKICYALNQRLPEDIRILQSMEVPITSHPRRCNCMKTYEYRILNQKIEIPTMRLYAYFCYCPLDVERMQKAAKYLIGEHDFKSFCAPRTQAVDTVRTIYHLDVIKKGDLITIRISGSGFLYHMVRIIAGTLMKVGRGIYPPEYMEEILAARSRAAAGPTAAAKGLVLIGLEEEEELRPIITAENKDWKYLLDQRRTGEEKKSFLTIERCAAEDFERLLFRMMHQAVRNGADTVYVNDRESVDRITAGKAYGYYVLQPAEDMDGWYRLALLPET